MAVRQRPFNSTAPFSGSPKGELKGSYPPSSSKEQEAEEEEDEGKESKVGYMQEEGWIKKNPYFNKLLTRGTAEQVGEMPIKSSTIIAQAECETQDSQEFSPSCSKRFVAFPNCFTSPSSDHNHVACPISASIQEAHNPLEKKSQRRTKSKGKRKKPGKGKEKQRRRHRIPSGVPEQESGLIQEEFSVSELSDFSTSRCSSVESLVQQEYGHPLTDRQNYPTGSSCSPLNWAPVFAYRPSFQPCEQHISSDSLSSLGDCSLALAGLRGVVSQADPCYVWPFFSEVENEARENEEELSTADLKCNEGIIFYNEKIQPMDSEYKEGSEYTLSRFIKDGSFGEVHSAQDVNTGFRFAAKKIALKRFRSEEVGTWSTLRSPYITELFGVIREGPNVVLLMEEKSGSLGQLLMERGRLPEDLSLHYHSQVLAALEYLKKKKVAHLDIKADNVLLSEDGKDAFLCDFGHAEKLDHQGLGLSGSRDLKGTETHMAPEIVKGELRGAKADVWSSCCMLLHMLNGCQPWTRYYTCRLYLKIANEPPPVREIPQDCSPLTAEVLKAGLQKDPVKRLSASQLREKTNRALKEVGGLTSAVRGPYTDPLYVPNKPPDNPQPIMSLSDFEDLQEHKMSVDREMTGTKNKVVEKDMEISPNEPKRESWNAPQMLIPEQNFKRNKILAVPEPELELRKLERDFYLSSLSQLPSAEMQEQLLSCINSDHYSNWELWDKKDSGRWSLSPGDDYSSGFFSYNSQPDVQVFSLDLLGQTPPCCFEGVDVSIRDFSGRRIQIREKRRVKVGHIATGISDQISERVFTLETQSGQQVGHDEEVLECGLELRCVPAPDFSSAWRWRIKDGVLEVQKKTRHPHLPLAEIPLMHSVLK